MRNVSGWTACLLVVSVSAAMAIAPSAAMAIAPPTVRVDDWNNDGVEDCNGSDQFDDTVCWQSALNAGKPPPPAFAYFGNVEASSGGRYIVSNTLTLTRAFGGVISGNGVVIEWRGPSNVPLFLLEDTQQLEIRDLQIESNTTFPLQTAFEFTNAPEDPQLSWGIAPIANIIRHVYVQGTSRGGLVYGVRFSNRYGIEPPRDCRRLQSLRGWSDGTQKQVLAGGPGAGRSDGLRA